MQAAARLEPLDTKTRRATGRRKLHLGSALSGSGDSVIIHDLSQGGMLIETAAKLARFDQLEVDLPETGVARARVGVEQRQVLRLRVPPRHLEDLTQRGAPSKPTGQGRTGHDGSFRPRARKRRRG